jgi:hypothetical protein
VGSPPPGEVAHVDGDLVDGGLGDSAEDALLEVAERLMPPTPDP